MINTSPSFILIICSLFVDLKAIKMSYTLSYYKKERKIHVLPKNITTIADSLKLYSESKPDHNAVVFASNDGSRTTVTYKELFETAIKVAKRFIALGLQENEYVAICMRTCPEWLYVFFGAMLARARPVNLSFTFKDGSDVVSLMQKMQTCSLIVLDPGEEEQNWNIFQKLITRYDNKGNVNSETMPYLKYLICHDRPKENPSVLTYTDMMAWENVCEDLPRIRPDDTFTLFQTSGSTGTSKMVMHTHKSFLYIAIAWVDAMKMDSESNLFNDRPFAWGGGFPSTVITGQTRVTRLEIAPPPKDSVAWLIEVVKRERCTHMLILPLGLHSVLQRQVSVSLLYKSRVNVHVLEE